MKAHSGLMTETVNGIFRPNVLHLKEVAELVQTFGGSATEIAAAWLHDSIEDTSTTSIDIKNLFGQEIARIVLNLTDNADSRRLSIFQRKLIQAARVREHGTSEKIIKLADQLSNIRALISDPPRQFIIQDCRDYLRGALLVAEQCRDANKKLFLEFMRMHKIAIEQMPTVLGLKQNDSI